MEHVKLSLFADDMVLYIENIENSTKKLSEYMDSVNLKNTKLIYMYLWHFYALVTHYQKEKLGKESLLQLHEKE